MHASSTQYHVKDVGRILVQVQQQLSEIRGALDDGKGKKGAQRDELMRSLDHVLRSAETDLRAKAELVLNASTQEAVDTFPSSGTNQPVHKSTPPRTVQLQTQPRGDKSRSRVRQRMEQARRMQFLTNPASDESRRYLQERFGVPHEPRHEAMQREQNQRLERAQERRERAAVHRPVQAKRTGPAGVGPMKGDPSQATAAIRPEDLDRGIMSLVERGFVPPTADLTPAFTHGAASLSQAPVVIHDVAEKHARVQTQVDVVGFNTAALRLDVQPPVHATEAVVAGRRLRANPPPTRGPVAEALQTAPPPTLTQMTLEAPQRGNRPRSRSPHHSAATAAADDDVLRTAVDKIRGYNELLDTFSLHQFIIRKGQSLRATPEFQSFQRTHRAEWGAISRIIKSLEDLFTRCGVPMAYIDGQRVATLARLEVRALTVQDLLSCVANDEDVGHLVQRAGSKFKGPHGRREAATCIQATRRMVVQRRMYETHKLEIRAALVIQHRLRLWNTVLRFRTRLAAVRREREERWRQLQDGLRARWPALREKRRVAIHVPSISADEAIRRDTPNLALRAASQLARVVAVADPLVDVLYVSPFPLSGEVVAYYRKLLAIGGVQDPSLRFKVVVPENLDRFPPHFSLSTLVTLSPRCLKRMASFIRGREAYLVPGRVGPEDRLLALHLGVPMLGPDPRVNASTGSKSGSKRIFAMADVNMPPGAHDLYEEEEVVTALARLIARYPDRNKWLVKLDDETAGRGTAYFETRWLPTLSALKKERERESERDPGYWSRPEVQEAAQERVAVEIRRVLPSRLVLPARPDGSKATYRAFMASLENGGGVVEACAADVRGSPSANLFIDPSGRVTVTSTHDQIFDAPFRFAGAAFPQQSVPHAAVQGAASAVGEVLFSRGVIGYVGLDFVAWHDDTAGALRLWAVDLNLRLTPTAVSFALFNFLLGGRFDPATGQYLVLTRKAPTDASTVVSSSTADRRQARTASAPASARDGPGGDAAPARFDGDALASDGASTVSRVSSLASRATSASGHSLDVGDDAAATQEARHYVAVPLLLHAGLASMQYASFFNQCRLRNVSFDLRRRVGTAFLLLDSLASGAIGALCVGHTAVAALQNLASTLRFIESQIGARPPQDEFEPEPSNFADIHQTVRAMLRAAGLPPSGERPSVTHAR